MQTVDRVQADVALWLTSLLSALGFGYGYDISYNVCSLQMSYPDCETESRLYAFLQVLRAQNLVAAEGAQSGQGHPGGVYPPGGNPTSQEGMALPVGLLHSVPLSESNMNARQKIQAKIDSQRFIKPTSKDTTRFQPKQVVKVCLELYLSVSCWLKLSSVL